MDTSLQLFPLTRLLTLNTEIHELRSSLRTQPVSGRIAQIQTISTFVAVPAWLHVGSPASSSSRMRTWRARTSIWCNRISPVSQNRLKEPSLEY